MSLTDGARTSVAARYRSRELSGDRRAGAWSRREVRRLQQQWLRKHWRVVAWIALGVVLACVLVEVFVPSQIRSYVVGALLASAAWWVYCLMITTGGLAGNGFRQRKLGKRAKSVSVDHSSRPCSMANAASIASGTRLTVMLV